MKLKYKMLFSDTIAFTVSSFASKILVFLLIPLYTSVLSTQQYGIADLITNTVNVVYPIMTLGIMEATLRFAFDEKNNSTDVLSNSLFVIIIAELIILIVRPFSSVFGKTMHEYWIWFAIIFGGFNLQEVLAQYTKGINKTKVFALAGIIQTMVIIISNIVGLLMTIHIQNLNGLGMENLFLLLHTEERTLESRCIICFVLFVESLMSIQSVKQFTLFI